MPESSVSPEKSKLCHIIEENLPGATILAVPRKYFRDDVGKDYLNQVLR
jgi:DNA mismatch repair protein MSH4